MEESSRNRTPSPEKTDDKKTAFLTEAPAPSESYHSYYHQLTSQISHLQTQVKSSIQHHEKDFLSAFRTHMYQVYQQLNDLKNRTDQQEIQRQRDEHVNKLQHSVEWFRDEALQLGNSCKFYKKECEKWKAKAEMEEDERKCLEIQLKAAKMQIKSYNDAGNKEESAPIKLPAVHKSELPVSNATHFLLQLSSKTGPSDPTFFLEIEKYMSAQEQRCKEAIRHMQSTLDAERKRMKANSAVQSSVFLAKSDLEGLFLQCVEEVRREVLKRRTQAVMSARYTTKAHLKEPKTGFTAQDKRRILELLISNEQVLVFLYEKLFPYRVSSVMHARAGSEVTPMPPEDLPEDSFQHPARHLKQTE